MRRQIATTKRCDTNPTEILNMKDEGATESVRARLFALLPPGVALGDVLWEEGSEGEARKAHSGGKKERVAPVADGAVGAVDCVHGRGRDTAGGKGRGIVVAIGRAVASVYDRKHLR